MSTPNPFAEAARQLEADLAAHAIVKASKRCADAQTHLSGLLADFSLLLQTVWPVASRFRTVPQQIPDLTPALDPSPQPVELVHADRS